MKTKLIVMFTCNDQTVPDAIEVFDGCRDLSVQFWGFKNVGLPVAEMKTLVHNIKASGKTACLEVVTYQSGNAWRRPAWRWNVVSII